MTLYMVQRCLFDHLRRLEAAGDGPRPEIVTEGYALTDEEKRAVTEPDIGAIYAMGAHPVIINGFCRDVFTQLPMEFAVEATKLLGLKLEGSVG